MALTDEEVERMKLKALDEQLKRETIQIRITKTGLTFTIDREKQQSWIRNLVEIGNPFTVINLETGEQVFELEDEDGNETTE